MLGAFGLMAFFTYRLLAPFFVPLLWAGLLAFLLFPINMRLRAVLREQKGTTALLLTVASVLGIFVPVAVLTVLVGTQASDLLRAMKVVQGVHLDGAADLIRIPAIQRILNFLTDYLPVGGIRFDPGP